MWLAARPGAKTPTLAKNTQRDDAPRRNPILHGDIPPRPEPLPRFLDDRDAARLMAAARSHHWQCELLDRRHWATRAELARAMFEWIEAFYNPTRRHSTLGYLSPIDYETAHAA